MYTSFQESYDGKDGGKPVLSTADFELRAPIKCTHCVLFINLDE